MWRVSPAKSTPGNSDADGSEKSVSASASDEEELTTNAKALAGQKLKERANMKVDSNAT